MRRRRHESGELPVDPECPNGNRLYVIRAHARERGWSQETVAYALSLPADLFHDAPGWTAALDLIEGHSRAMLVELRALSC